MTNFRIRIFPLATFCLLFLLLPLKTKSHLAPYKVLILGNSITIHGPSKELEWYGNWGMAASSQEKDYAHLLIENLKSQHKNLEFIIGNVATTFESKFGSLDTLDFVRYKNFHPDLTIIRLGDNIEPSYMAENSICDGLKSLTTYINTDKTITCITSRFWGSKQIDDPIKQCALNNKWIYVDLAPLSKDTTNMAWSLYRNKGVGRHPSDKGMAQIKDKIWQKIKDLK